jgi:hypothetical protein
MHNIKSELRFRFIKMMDIGYMVILYFMFGILLSKVTDVLFRVDTPEELQKSSTTYIIVETIIMIWTNMILFYIARNVMELIPSPFDKLYGYDHSRLKEVTNTAVLGLTYIYFQAGLRNNLNELNNRFTLSKNLSSTSDFLYDD